MHRTARSPHHKECQASPLMVNSMSIDRIEGSNAGLAEVLDRILDKGIVIDAWLRVSGVGIDLITVYTRVVVASVATYREKWDEHPVAGTSRGAPSARSASRVAA